MRSLSFSSILLLAFCLHGCGKAEAPPAATPDAGASIPESPDAATSLGESSEMSASETSTSTESSAAISANTGSSASASGSTLNYIPQDAVAAFLVRPGKALNNPIVKQMIHLMDEANPERKASDGFEAFEQQMGVKPEQVDHILVVVDQQLLQMLPFLMMMGDRGENNFEDLSHNAVNTLQVDRQQVVASATTQPVLYQPGAFGEMGPRPVPIVVIQLADGVNSQQVLNSIPGGESIEIAGGTGVTAPDGNVVFKVSDSRVVYSSKEKLESVLKNSSQGGVGTMLAKSATSDFALVIDMEPVKGFLQQTMQNNPNPAMGMVMPIVSQLKMLTITADLEAAKLLQVSVDTPNAEAAEGVQGMLSGFLNMGKQQYTQAKEQVPAEMQALTQQLVDGATLTTAATIVSLTVPRPSNFELLPEMLKPAINKAADAAKSSMNKNNLKQIGLAFHNYHDAYKHFPAVDSSGDKEDPNVKGKGLSWRVHLLPFIKEFPLYNEFNLDEPWDSEHNKALIGRMPKVFGNDPEGKTSVHVFVGDNLAFGIGKPGPALRDYLDGTSNTLLAVEAGTDTADIWTKPGGLELNTEDPLAALKNIGDTFLALFCDGSVRAISKSTDKTTLSNLIQHNDGNPIGQF